jgi:hypothetical protein
MAPVVPKTGYARKHPQFASSALTDPRSKSFIAAVNRLLRRAFDQFDDKIDWSIKKEKVPA